MLFLFPCYHVLDLGSFSTMNKPVQCDGFQHFFTVLYPKLINRKSSCFQTLVSLATTVPENGVVYMMCLSQNSTPQMLGFHHKAQWMSCMNRGLAVGWRPTSVTSPHSRARAFLKKKKTFFPPLSLFVATPQGMWDLSFPDQELNPCPLQ